MFWGLNFGKIMIYSICEDVDVQIIEPFHDSALIYGYQLKVDKCSLTLKLMYQLAMKKLQFLDYYMKKLKNNFINKTIHKNGTKM